ncbi:hypothetical protein Tco_0839566 [Tanacetum coccineum]|uniref:Reverse transcriptase zinc-binding domain-containing protein n=1 Tax=Tanacetum coccineum TaxID=301880 RepID=A0ABQ5ASU8_9ASTR
MSEFGGVENTSARGANGDASIGRVGGVWLSIGGVMVSARVVSRVVGMEFFVEWERIHLKKVIIILFMKLDLKANYPKQEKAYCGTGSGETIGSIELANTAQGIGCSSQKILLLRWAKVGSCRQSDQGCNYPPDHFLVLDEEWERVTKIIPKGFEGEAFSHKPLSYAPSLWVILVSRKAYDIFAKDSLPLFEVKLDFEAQHLKGIKNNDFLFDFAGFPRGSFIKDDLLFVFGISIKEVVMGLGDGTWRFFLCLTDENGTWRAREIFLLRRDIDIDSIMCAICDNGVETSRHLFFYCCMVRQIVRKITRWYRLPITSRPLHATVKQEVESKGFDELAPAESPGGSLEVMVHEKQHHHSSSIAGGGVIIGGLVTVTFVVVCCYIRVTRRRDDDKYCI